MNEFSSVSAVLDELVPAVEQEEPAWDDVLARVERLETASVPRVGSARRRRMVPQR